MEPDFPFEFVVSGTPVSLGSSSRSRKLWKQEIQNASKDSLPEGYWLTKERIAVTLYYFPAENMQGDIDNIVKPILDSLNNHIYVDDHQVERVVVQKFEPDNFFAFDGPSERLTEAIAGEKPKLYIRMSTDPFEELR
ncbi:RusA family crossover junction endodeoxyribonuclease [Allomesorhizobium camelthorni]|uniref:RusA family crossover junction endodeoxyribonuclease n=1 Tax=Allomesorhizobium camelthorni TaxID=475069 RepID=A0A6G4WLT8_9HYPH|nr:RusA family crossover junction endodeoxyribonuclease [Mesorhizobium camelthorni]NGO55731.1 RusA family crossover junction endodeoxyribonuclease [Mesorhizobium camelthorni]